MACKFTIRAPKPDENSKLHEIEARSSERFAEHGFSTLSPGTQGYLPLDLATFDHWMTEYAVWVAADENDLPIGFAMARELDGIYYIHELAVLPEMGQKGIGTALLEAMIAEAKWAFHSAICLSTFKNVPFNAPFYRKHGFLAVETEAVSPELQAQFYNDVPKGVLPSTRTLMMKRL